MAHTVSVWSIIPSIVSPRRSPAVIIKAAVVGFQQPLVALSLPLLGREGHAHPVLDVVQVGLLPHRLLTHQTGPAQF